jgi:hypothetical protein
MTPVQFAKEWSIVIMDATRYNSLAVTERARHAQLCGDSFPNKRALVGKLVQELGQLLFDLERHNRCFWRFMPHAEILFRNKLRPKSRAADAFSQARTGQARFTVGLA